MRQTTHTRNPLLLLATALLMMAAALTTSGCGDPQTTFANPGPGPSDNEPDDGDNNSVPCTNDFQCAVGQSCCLGQCRPQGSCNLSVCEAQNDACSLSGSSGIEAQGDFYCALLNADDGPTCLGQCENTFSPDVCAPESYCLSVNSGEETLNVCVPSECTAHDDCRSQGPDGGTCVPFGNRTGFCFAAGVAPMGASCGGGTADTTCASGLYCIAEADGATCQPLCDMWQGEDPCPTGRTCGYLTVGTGVCRTQTTTGRQLDDTCDPLGAWCAPGSQCLDFRTGGESLPVCTAYCRPQAQDCRGQFGDNQGFCRTVFSGSDGEPIEDIGLCL